MLRESSNAFIFRGIFNLTTKELEYFNLNQKELEIIKPLYTSNEINRYCTHKENSKWIIYTDSSFKNEDKINDYPNIKYHLDKFKSSLESLLLISFFYLTYSIGSYFIIIFYYGN